MTTEREDEVVEKELRDNGMPRYSTIYELCIKAVDTIAALKAKCG